MKWLKRLGLLALIGLMISLAFMSKRTFFNRASYYWWLVLATAEEKADFETIDWGLNGGYGYGGYGSETYSLGVGRIEYFSETDFYDDELAYVYLEKTHAYTDYDYEDGGFTLKQAGLAYAGKIQFEILDHSSAQLTIEWSVYKGGQLVEPSQETYDAC